MKTVYMVYTGGSGNRGCEAIVRGTNRLLEGYNNVVFTANINDEIESGLSEDIHCTPLIDSKKKNILKHGLCWLSYRFGSGKLQTKLIYPNVFKTIKKNDAYLVIGGDVYCYGKPYMYYHINSILKESKRILWGCSIEPDSIDDEMKRDLLSYDMIYARESITYNALLKKGINRNTKLYPDPAFAMEEECLPLPENFIEGNTIGINLSPLIIEREKTKGITFTNYIRLVEYILKTTDCNIALIPHVIWENSDDRKPLKQIYDRFKETGRVVLLKGYSAEKIKGYISRCRFMIAARTHASIAAYSTCVPTLVVGYSVKARGIAKDIFGSYDKYVVPVQTLEDENGLLNSFKWMWEREAEIKHHLKTFMPNYIARLKDVYAEVEKIIK